MAMRVERHHKGDMNGLRIKKKLQAGETVFGMFLADVNNPAFVEMLQRINDTAAREGGFCRRLITPSGGKETAHE